MNVRRFVILIVLVVAGTAWAGYVWKRGPWLPARTCPDRPPVIAHAGGCVESGLCLTNSLEALDAAFARGHRCFELDFNWTSDGELVCVHDWEDSFERQFGGAIDRPPSLDVFRKLKRVDSLTQLTLEAVVEWLSRHETACLVTDIKVDNLDGLQIIADRYPRQRGQVLPQVYQPDEIQHARELGFEQIILTLYRCSMSRRDLLRRLQGEELYAVTLPVSRAARWQLAANLKQGGFFTYAHTVNSVDQLRDLQAVGVCGVYTDALDPEDLTR